MLYQYHCQRRRGGSNPHGRGVLNIGEIYYLQDFNPFGGIRGLGRHQPPVCRNPWIVESFANREYFPAVKGAAAVSHCAGGHLVTVRSLRDGERRQVADWLILRAIDADMEWGGQRGQAARRIQAARAASAGGKAAASSAAERRAA